MIMTQDDLLDPMKRLSLIEYINGQENKDRRSRSLEDFEVYTGEIEPYVLDRLRNIYSEETIREIPVVSTINIAKKVVDSKASIYKDDPIREFNEVTDDQEEVLEDVYNDMWFNSKMLNSNRLFKLQQQNHVMILPKNGKLQARPLKLHQVDVVPNYYDPERAEIYIISGFDKYESTRREASEYDNGVNEPIGDEDDYKSLVSRYLIWSEKYHFVMDGKANILPNKDGETVIDNPIGMIPIVEVSEEKDLEYFIQFRNIVTAFTVQYNEQLSKLAQIVDLQGFAQAYLKAPHNLMPQSVTVGPNRVLKLVTDPNMEGDVEFGYASPNADLDGAQNYVISLLSQFLSAEGLNSNAITANSSSDKFNSGFERLLAMIERFEASSLDQSKYEQVEKMAFKIIAAWLNELNGTELLDDKYKTTPISDNASLSIQYRKPEVVKTEMEMLDLAERKMELGLTTPEKVLAELENKTIDEARDALEDMNGVQETESNEERSQPEIQS